MRKHEWDGTPCVDRCGRSDSISVGSWNAVRIENFPGKIYVKVSDI